MALIKDGVEVNDSFVDARHAESLPATGDILVSLEQWREHRDALLARGTGLGVVLKSDEHPDAIAADIEHLDVIALEFPVFTDGRAYSYARILRDQYGFAKELRAVGDVLLEQLLYMNRVGFNAFDIVGDNDLKQWKVAVADYSVWYQPTNDGRRTIRDLRRG
jgi:uncharacterized protein (DUF934 family)